MVEDQHMYLSSANTAKKRSYRESFCPEEFTHKFSSKQDLHIYMSEHRKWDLSNLTEVV